MRSLRPGRRSKAVAAEKTRVRATVEPSSASTADDDDSALARRLIEGQPEAALVAWRRFHRSVENLLRRMLGSGTDVQDLTQEVFLRFFTKVRKLEKVESVRPFVLAISVRRAQEEIKKRRVRRWFAPLVKELMSPLPHTAMDPDARQTIVHFYRALDQLSATDRSIYLLRYVEELEHAQISDVLGLSISTVRRRIERAAARMNRIIKADPVLAEYVGALRRRTGQTPVPESRKGS